MTLEGAMLRGDAGLEPDVDLGPDVRIDSDSD
jgi:hypothetical protein